MRYLFLLLSTCFCFSQTELTDSQLKEDYDILKTVISELSPALTIDEKKNLIDYFESHKHELDGKSLSSIEFFRFLIELKANTKTDEHGALTLSADVMKEILTHNSILFPIPIVIMDDKLIVNHESLPLPYGSIIHEINDRKVGDILDDMLKSKDAFSLRSLEPSFDVLFLIKFGRPDKFKVLYTAPNSTEALTVWVDPIDIKSREALYKDAVYPFDKESLSNLLNIKYFEDKDTYYIQLNSFNSKADDDKFYKSFEDEFDDIFKEIKKKEPKNLIIDLRYNYGGRMIIPSLFYSYIATKPFTEFMEIKVPDFNLPYKEYIHSIEGKTVDEAEIDAILDNFKKPFNEGPEGFEHIVFNDVSIKPNKRAYEGKVYLLVGGRTFSAASHYVALFASENRGTIIGEQIGGSHKTITAGMQIQYELPNSKLIIGMPIGVFGFSESVTNIPGKKIEPDIRIPEETKYHYFLKKEDWGLIEALKLID